MVEVNLYQKIRSSSEYDERREKIKARDDKRCQNCFKKFWDKRIGKYKPLTVHHIKEFYKIILENNIKNMDDALRCEELWDIKNGILLCNPCHVEEHLK